MKNFLKEYKEFINKGDVVVVAVGLVMALYFKAIVDQLIAAVITPIIALIFGESTLDDIGFTISDTFFPIGLVFGAIIDFLAVALILFFVIKAYNKFKGPTRGGGSSRHRDRPAHRDPRSAPVEQPDVKPRVERRFNGRVNRRRDTPARRCARRGGGGRRRGMLLVACGSDGDSGDAVAEQLALTPLPTVGGVGVLPAVVEPTRERLVVVTRPINEDGTVAELDR